MAILFKKNHLCGHFYVKNYSIWPLLSQKPLCGHLFVTKTYLWPLPTTYGPSSQAYAATSNNLRPSRPTAFQAYGLPGLFEGPAGLQKGRGTYVATNSDVRFIWPCGPDKSALFRRKRALSGRRPLNKGRKASFGSFPKKEGSFGSFQRKAPSAEGRGRVLSLRSEKPPYGGFSSLRDKTL